MDWLSCLRQGISFVESHLMDDINADDVADDVHVSTFYLQKGFHIMTGYTIAEYIRNRRLYLAALELVSTKDKVIDIALKYGYDNSGSFSKAFARFHGAAPMQIRRDASQVKTFLPLKISIKISGGSEMDYVVESMKGFKVIGYTREFNMDSAYNEIPKFWDEIYQSKIGPLFGKVKPETDEEETICNCCVGEYGVSIDDIGKDGRFRYMIAGVYTEGEVPEGMSVYEFPDVDWAKFKCVGPMPGALQAVNTKVFSEWLPNNEEYEIALGVNIEWYSNDKDMQDANYESAIWIPVKKK